MITPDDNQRDQVDELAESFVARFRAGERPSIEEYARRYPNLADELRQLLPALVLLEQHGLVSDDAASRRAFNAPSVPREIGEFTIVREIGRGGMGVVYEAVQQSLGRHVALKVLSSGGLLNPTHLERFRLEARSAGRLHHSHIVPVFGVGESDGLHYYAMQFIAGQSLDQVIDALRKIRPGYGDVTAPSVNDELTEAIVGGLLNGHSGRESAPDPHGDRSSDSPATLVEESAYAASDQAAARRNVTGQFSSGSSGRPFYESVARVGLQVAEALAYAHAEGILHRDIKPSNLLLDAKGSIWVTDFGLVKADDTQSLTDTGDFVGTLRYLAPERLEGWSDRRSDIYGLGATLYELLTLHTFFEKASRAQLIDHVRHKQPETPTKIDPAVPRDLETIVLKALAKEPGSRYHTADQMAEDLRRFLADRPILARRSTARERLVRWCRRNPAVASLTAAVALSLILATIGATLAAVQSNRLVEREQQRADEEARAREELGQRLYANRIALAQQELYAQNTGRAQELLDDCPVTLRGWEWNFLQRFGPGNPLTIAGPIHMNVVAFSADGQQIATCNSQGTVDIVDVATGRIATAIPVSGVHGIAFSPNANDGVLATPGYSDKLVRIWDVKSGRQIRALEGHTDRPRDVAFSPDGVRLASGGYDGSLKVWDWKTGQLLLEPKIGRLGIARMTFRPDGKHIAAGIWGGAKEVVIVDAHTGKEVRSFGQHSGGIEGVAYSPDGSFIATSASDGTVKIWNESTGELVRVLKGHTGPAYDVAYSPDGTRLVSAGWDKTVKIWNAATGQETLTLRGHSDYVIQAAFSPDGHCLASCAGDATMVWNAAPLKSPAKDADRIDVPGHKSAVKGVAFSPDGKKLASGGSDRLIKLWDVASLTRAESPQAITLTGHSDSVTSVDFSPDSQLLASCGWDHTVKIWDAVTPSPLLSLAIGNTVESVAFSPDGRRLASLGPENLVVWDTSTGKALARGSIPTGDVRCIAYSPDGRNLALNKTAGVEIWDATNATHVRWLGYNLLVWGVAYSPNGQQLAATSCDHSIRIWDTSSWQELRTLHGHTDRVVSVAYSPDGKWMASGSGDATVRVWNVRDGQEVATLRGHTGYVWSVAFSPDGKWLASGGGNYRKGDLKLWHLTTLDAANDSVQVATARRQAAEFYQLLATAQPKVWEHRRNLGQAYAQNDEWNKATDAYLKAIELNPAALEEISHQLNARVRAGASGSVIARVAEVYARLVDVPTVSWRVRIVTLGALSDLIAASGQGPEVEDVQKMLAQMCDRVLADRPQERQDRDRLEVVLGQVVEKTQRDLVQREKLLRALSDVREALARDFPNVPRYREGIGHAARLLGGLLSRQGRFDEAQDCWRRAALAFEQLAAADIPQRDGFYRSFQADTLIHLASVLANSRHQEEAAAKARESVALYEALVRDFPRNLEYREQMSWAVLTLAERLAAAGHALGAVQACRQQISFCEEYVPLPLVNFKPQLATAYLALSFALYQNGAIDESKQAWNRAVEIGHFNANTLNRFAWNLVTARDVEPDVVTFAVDTAKHATSTAPDRADCWNTLGVAQYRAGNWEESIESLTKAEELAPHNTLAFNGFFLAMAHWQLGHKDEARAWYDRSVEWTEENQPQNGELIRFRAEAERLLGITKPDTPVTNAPPPAPISLNPRRPAPRLCARGVA